MKHEEIGRMLRDFDLFRVPETAVRFSNEPLQDICSFFDTFSDDELEEICKILGIEGGE